MLQISGCPEIELVRHRGLLWALVVRTLAARYRRSFLGFLWSFLNPLLLAMTYLLVFKYYARFSAIDNYALFLLSGLLPWVWFSSALVEGASSIVASGHLITKSLFPAIILPAVSVVSTGINFILGLPVLIFIAFFLGIELTLAFWQIVPLIIIQTALTFGIVLILASLNVFYRDIQHLIGNILTFVFFLCPIVYSATTVPEAWRFTVDYNPLALLFVGYQNAVLYGNWTDGWVVLITAASASVMIGIAVYNHYCERFAEAL